MLPSAIRGSRRCPASQFSALSAPIIGKPRYNGTVEALHWIHPFPSVTVRRGPARGQVNRVRPMSKIALSQVFLNEEARAAAIAALDSGMYVLGPETGAFDFIRQLPW